MADLALVFDILAKDKASKEFEKVSRSVKGATGEVAKDTDRAADSVKRSYKKIGDSSDRAAKTAPKFGGAMKAGMATAVGAVVAGAAAMSAAFMGAMDADAAKKKLSAELGLTGAESERIGGVAGKLYAKAYGDSMSDVTGAVGAVMSSIEGASKLPTGALEDLTARAMDYAAVFEVDVTRAAQVAGQAVKTGLADNATEAFDLLTAASQKVPVALREDILDAVDEYGPMFAQLGFSGEEAFAALVKGADKGQYGIDKTGDALKEFTIRATDMSKTSTDAFGALGLDAGEMGKKILAGGEVAGGAMQEIVAGLLAMEDPAARANTAIALFGTPLEDLGTEGIPAFLQSLSDTGDGLGEIEGSTKKAGDALNDNLGTKLKTLGRELSQRFQPAMAAVIDFVTDKVLPGVDKLTDAWSNQVGPVGRVREAFDNVVAGVRDFVMPIFDAWTGTVRDHVLPVLNRLWTVVRDEIGPVFLDMVGVVRDRVLPILRQMWMFVAEKVAPVLWDLANRVVVPVFRLIGSAIKTAWELVIKPALGAIDTILRTVIGPAFSWLWTKVVSPVFRLMGNAISAFARGFTALFDGLRAAAARPINFIIDAVWNKGLRKLIGMIPGVSEPGAIPLISIPSSGGGRAGSGGRDAVRAFARGGILPGSSRIADGDDQLIWARRGEGITITEALDSYERQRLLALNAAVARGQSPTSFRAGLEAHAGGGIVGFRGHRFTPRFVQSLQQAEATSGQKMYISQGGFRPRTSYSGTSHQGDAVDIMRPITTALITALRAAGIAAWDRTGKGRWAPHIHGVPLPGYGRAAGSAVWQAQDYLRGGDGLGGRDNGPRVAAGRNNGPYVADGPNLLAEIPKLFGQVRDALGGLTGPWGELLKTGMREVIGKVYRAATEKVVGLADTFKELLGISSPARGYALGTSHAAPGLAWVGERGPELVRFRGGERVYTASESRAAAPATQEAIVRIELVDERLRELFRAEVRQMQREGLVAA